MADDKELGTREDSATIFPRPKRVGNTNPLGPKRVGNTNPL
jgi:hypothetical protein